MSVLDEILKTIQHPGPPPFNPNEPHSDAQRRYALDLANKAGELHKAIFDDAISSNASNLSSIMKGYLRDIHERKGVSQPESALLERIIESVTSKSSVEQIAEEVAGIHAELRSLKGGAGPIALAISAIGVDSTNRARHSAKHKSDVKATGGGVGPIASPLGRVGAADVMGALGGARLCLAIEALVPWAAVGGAVIGGAAASIAMAL